jgi:hypothetical protein
MTITVPIPPALPVLPTAPGANASDAEKKDFEDAFSLYSLAVRAIQACAQAAIANATEAQASAQRATLAAAVPSREEIIMRTAADIVGKQARGSRTNKRIAADAIEVATELYALMQPAVVAGPLVPTPVPAPTSTGV